MNKENMEKDKDDVGRTDYRERLRKCTEDDVTSSDTYQRYKRVFDVLDLVRDLEQRAVETGTVFPFNLGLEQSRLIDLAMNDRVCPCADWRRCPCEEMYEEINRGEGWSGCKCGFFLTEQHYSIPDDMRQSIIENKSLFQSIDKWVLYTILIEVLNRVEDYDCKRK